MQYFNVLFISNVVLVLQVERGKTCLAEWNEERLLPTIYSRIFEKIINHNVKCKK